LEKVMKIIHPIEHLLALVLFMTVQL